MTIHQNSIFSSRFVCVICSLLALSACTSEPPAQISLLSTASTLNTGKDILPADVTPLTGANLPMTLTATPDGRFVIICGMGYREALWAVTPADAKIVGRSNFNPPPTRQRAEPLTEEQPLSTTDPASQDAGESTRPTNRPKPVSVYYGLAATNSTVYAAQGGHDSIAVLSISNTGQLAQTDTIPARKNDFPAGLALDQKGLLYVSNNSSGGIPGPYRIPASMAIYDPTTKTELGRYVFQSTNNTSNYPLAITVRRDGSTTYVASERDGTVYSLSTKDPAHPTLNHIIPTGSNPDALLLNNDESRLFVANSKSDTISVIDTTSDNVIGTILLRPDAVRGLPGVTPTSLALSRDEKTLYVTLSDMNAVGIVDVDSLTIRGMIPAGDYPSAILATNNRLLVVNAKGHNAHNPNPNYNPFVRNIDRSSYILTVILGDVQNMPIPPASNLSHETDIVMAANHVERIAQPPTDPLLPKQIKHVIYVIKENRTYDQVMGDDIRGNGDPNLALFNKEITPNQHAIADRFVLLDNTYACGEVSGDGWVWSTQGIANPYVERTIPYNYASRGRTFDYEGANNGYPTGGFPATDPDGKPLSNDPQYANGAPPIPDVAGADVHIWDLARNANLPIRNYGFYLSDGDKQHGVTVIPDNYPTVAGLQPPGHDLAGVTDIDFRKFDLDYPDSDAPKIWFDRTTDKNCLYLKQSYGKYSSPSRYSEWNREFQQMLQKDPTGNSVPALMMIRLPHDHTQGLMGRKHTPASEVADNDYAIGQLVDTVSHSPIWESTAIFIIEDDAQAGPDHVDCHRTTCFAISPWIKRATVDDEFHNTDSVLKTMELLLNLPPMSQYDAIAKPISDWDTSAGNSEPYTAVLPAKEIIAAVNVGRARSDPTAAAEHQLELASDQMDFVHADAAPAAQLNNIIWKSVKGMDSAMPPPRNSLVSPKTPPKDDDDDD